MGLDNIESVDAIVSIADEILKDKVMQEFLNIEDANEWCWEERSGEGCSDIYIENLAYEMIIEEYV
jgi:hypothetical protein